MVFLEASTIAGAVKPVLEFARQATAVSRQRAIDMTMILFSRAGQKDNLTEAIQAENLPLKLITERHPLDFGAISQIRALARELSPDIVWTNNTKSHCLVRMAGLNKSANWIAFHHGYTREAWRTRLYNEVDRFSLPRADRVVTVCNDFAWQLQSKGVPAARLRVIRNPIRPSPPTAQLERTRARNQLGLTDARVLLSIGRLSLEKGHADLLRAFALMRMTRGVAFESRLLIVGDGPERQNLQALSSELKLVDAVQFAGYQADVASYYAAADVFVLPSHSEGSPNVLLEAMAAGLPVVATAVGGVPEILSDEVNALLVPKQNEKALANSIERLLNDFALAQRLVAKSKDVVAQHDPQVYFRAILGVFEEVMGEGAAA